MNLGIYVSTLTDYSKLQPISDCINKNIDSGLLKDASLFYDNIGYNPFTFRCGIFNSTELWNFHGKLITTSLSTTLSSLKIVNNIDVYYYYGFEEKISPLSLIYIIKNEPKLKFVSTSESVDNDLYRKTGVRSHFVSDSFEDLVSRIST
jgi:hypothetical protein